MYSPCVDIYDIVPDCLNEVKIKGKSYTLLSIVSDCLAQMDWFSALPSILY